MAYPRAALYLVILNELQSLVTFFAVIRYPWLIGYLTGAVTQGATWIAHRLVYAALSFVLLGVAGCAYAADAPKPTIDQLQAQIVVLQHQHEVDTIVIGAWKQKASMLEETLIKQNAEISASATNGAGTANAKR